MERMAEWLRLWTRDQEPIALEIKVALSDVIPICLKHVYINNEKRL